MRKFPSLNGWLGSALVAGAFLSFSVYFCSSSGSFWLSLLAFEGSLILCPLVAYVGLSLLTKRQSVGARDDFYRRGAAVFLIFIALFAISCFLIVKPMIYPDRAHQELVTMWFWSMLTKP